MSFFSWSPRLLKGLLLANFAQRSVAFVGSQYKLDTEYSGINFFDGWNFYTGNDPTGGFVTYYSRSSAQLTGLISTSANGPAYMGVNSVDVLPLRQSPYTTAPTLIGDGAGRPSVRIASQKTWTHGLFIGDFAHIPAGICGTWPAFWTLGPNWPYTGEIDIMEGVNANTNNIMSLHTNETCFSYGNASTQTGVMGNTNCAYYPDYNVGCGVIDSSNTSFGAGFNNAGGGVYAMQWTSEYIRIWYWSRDTIPSDVQSGNPVPVNWGLPSGQLAVGNCSVDQHFQQHQIIFDNTFCGEYAGNPYVWNATNGPSCAALTNTPTCDAYVADNPSVFKDSYWEVNYVRVYQLVDPAADPASSTTYIASLLPANTATQTYSTMVTPTSVDLSQTTNLCPQYNYSVITDGTYSYEIACDYDIGGPDLTDDFYQSAFTAHSMADCITRCTQGNQIKPNTCGGASFYAAINKCYFKKYFDATPSYRPGYNEIRRLFYGYPQVGDNPNRPEDVYQDPVFVPIRVTPQIYSPTITPASTSTHLNTTTATVTTVAVGIPGQGINNGTAPLSTGTFGSTLPANFSSTAAYTNISAYGTTVTATLKPANTTWSSGSAATSSTFPAAISTISSSRSSSSVSAASSPVSVSSTSSTSTRTSSMIPPISYTSASSQSGSVSDATTILSTAAISATPSSAYPDFYITFNEDVATGSRRLSKRDIQYLAFDDNAESIVVSDESQASLFTIDQSYNLITAGAYVALGSSTDNSQLVLVATPPSVPVTIGIGSNGAATIYPFQHFCVNPDGSLTASSSSVDESTCAALQPELVEAPAEAMMSTTILPSTTSYSFTPVTIPASRQSVKQATSSFASNSASATGSPSPSPSSISNFAYVGCFAVPESIESLASDSTTISDTNMTNDLCISICKNKHAYQAGTFGTQCFCGTTPSVYKFLTAMDSSRCSTSCPGNANEKCGGTYQHNLQKRQPDTLLLISLYQNLALLRSGSLSGSAPLPLIQPIQPTPTYFDPSLVSYNITGTHTATVLSTTYIDVCSSNGALTITSTTITVPHCGCTVSHDPILTSEVLIPSPTIPMTVMVKPCNCGPQQAASTVTVTCPDTSSIAAMTTAASSADAIASAAAHATTYAASVGAVLQTLAGMSSGGALPASIASAPATAQGGVGLVSDSAVATSLIAPAQGTRDGASTGYVPASMVGNATSSIGKNATGVIMPTTPSRPILSYTRSDAERMVVLSLKLFAIVAIAVICL